MTVFLADLRTAARSLLARPTFFLTATATLALGICALAAIFSVYDAVLLKPLPYADADRIVAINRVQPPIARGSMSHQVFEEWRDGSRQAFSAFAGYVGAAMNLTGAGDPERLTGYAVTPGFWQVFGSPIALGRGFDDGEETRHENVAVLSDALWRDRFGTSPDVIGRDIALDGETYRVVGVAAPGFRYPGGAQVWKPTFLPASAAPRSNSYLDAVARLADGVTVAQASQRLTGIAAWQARQWPDNHRGLGAQVSPLAEDLFGRLRQPLAMLLLASALVLAIACANLANLMLARGQGRAREFALRRAVGAGRSDLVRVVLAEAAVITLVGAGIGVAAADAAVRALAALAPPDLLPSTAMPSVDWRVAAVILSAALATLLLSGLAPAWRAAGSDPADALRGGGRDTGGTRSQGRLRAALVATELALALTLLSGSALLISSLRHLVDVDAGVRTEHVLTLKLSLPTPAQAPGESLLVWLDRAKKVIGPRIEAIQTRVQALPGIRSAGLVDALPISGGGGSNGDFTLPGYDIPDDQKLAEHRFVSEDYFAALGIPLRAGRVFEAHDGDDAGFGSRVLVNQAFVDRFMPGKNAIGQQIAIIDDAMKSIVGVVGDARQFGLDEAARPEVYFPMRTTPFGEMSLVVKVDGDPLAFAEPLRRALAEVAPDVPVYAVRTMDDATRLTTAMRRFNLSLMSVFAAVALALAAIGLYGVIAYAVGQRRREIGLRQAIGANAGHIHRLVLGSGARMVVPGIVFGILGALALGRAIAAQLYGVDAADPLLLFVVAAALAAVAFGACAIPMMRATAVTPVEALRND